MTVLLMCIPLASFSGSCSRGASPGKIWDPGRCAVCSYQIKGFFLLNFDSYFKILLLAIAVIKVVSAIVLYHVFNAVVS